MVRRRKKQTVRKTKTRQELKAGKTETKSFRWGESYTSLLLGIIVVIIGVLFFVSLAKTRQTKQVTSISTNIATITTLPLHLSPTTVVTQTPTKTLMPTNKPTPTNTPTPMPTSTPTPTQSPTSKPTYTPTPTLLPTATPTTKIQPQNNQREQSYTVASGDDLWHIAEKFYRSGYNWVDIARANNLENPGMLFSGTKLIIPQVTPAVATIQLSPTQMPAPPKVTEQEKNNSVNAINTNTYTVQKGDNLWDISVRAYANGYKWPDIAKANNLADPSLIHSGNILKIPR